MHRWFGVDGALLGAANGPPSPGAHAPALDDAGAAGEEGDDRPAGDAEAVEAGVASGGDVDGAGDALAWTLVIAVAAGGVGGAAAQRLMSARQARRGVPPSSDV